MRYIDMNSLEESLPNGWVDRAKKALHDIYNLPIKERSKAIEDRSNLWKEIKSKLEDLSYGKCWYCESINCRSDNDVDHFRPKGKVFECPEHEGYWWLAFEWTNFRFSCTYCNRMREDKMGRTKGGKCYHFPILEGSIRAKCDKDYLDKERPTLLDPTCPTDPSLLWFCDSGDVVPKFSNDPNCDYYKRADTSITIYHLRHGNLVKRRSKLCKDIRKEIEKADLYFKKIDHNPDNPANNIFCDLIYKLKKRVHEESEFSAAAHATLIGMRANYEIIVDMVLYP